MGHADCEALRSGLPELFREAAEHCRAGQLELGGPGGMVHRDEELAVTDELRTNLSRHLGTDDVLPTAHHAPEDKGVFHAALA